VEFGYFTLSDNHYDDNERDANAFVADILAEAVYAEEVGLHSAGSASIISRRWVSSPARIWCSPISQPGRDGSRWRRQ
jgi:hypothetical protein